MKKTIAIMLVLLIALSTVFAGVTFSGSFRQGVTLTVKDGEATFAPRRTQGGRLNITAKDENGLWSAKLNSATTTNANDKLQGSATINLDKALKEADIDLPFAVALTLGTSELRAPLSAYLDDSGFYSDSYYNIRPATGEMIGATLTYDKYAKVQVMTPITTEQFVVSALSEPIDGVKAAFGYSKAAASDKGYIIATANADAQKLLDLDFDVIASGLFIMNLDNESAPIQINAELKGEYEDAEVYVEYRYNFNKSMGLYAGAGYDISKKCSVSAYLD